jgi:hypothetical protein
LGEPTSFILYQKEGSVSHLKNELLNSPARKLVSEFFDIKKEWIEAETPLIGA